MDEVKIAYVIAVHKNPQQFSRLVDRLNGSHADFFVHVDKKSPINEFKNSIKAIAQDNFYFIKQFNAAWSEFGIVEAEIQALKDIVNKGKHYDMIILLSGQDYPIKSNDYIKIFFHKWKGKSFIESFPMPFQPWPNGGMDRINRYHFKILGKSFSYPPYKQAKGAVRKILNGLFGLYFKERSLPLGMKPFGGEHWWNFNMETARYIVQFLEQHPEFIDFHKFSFCADEMFFQTLLRNSTGKSIYDNIINDDLRYYDWSEGKDSPKTFTLLDLENLTISEKLFARKFDPNLDNKILDELDKVIQINYQN
ncbi:MAG: beta-1,6-N-acetylglucosaminyltransferase [Bacteroidota bacterium]|nr:beta-1,6-N-acetylglucosaminyltransferase [Bacteroidota bacterium]